MADLDNQTRGDKRGRLVASASDLLHRRGVQTTTLAEIAEAAGVPPGNVYYYFKTKDDLVRAVVESRANEVRAMLGMVEERRTPAARIKAVARRWVEMRDLVAGYGCPLGTLCSELSKGGEVGLDRDAAMPISLILEWAEDQFRQMGRRDGHELANTFFAAVQGGALLANTFHDPDIMTSQVRRLERWIDSLT